MNKPSHYSLFVTVLLGALLSVSAFLYSNNYILVKNNVLKIVGKQYADKNTWIKFKGKEPEISFLYPSDFKFDEEYHEGESYGGKSVVRLKMYVTTFTSKKDSFIFQKLTTNQAPDDNQKPCRYCTKKSTIKGKVWWITPLNSGQQCDAGNCWDIPGEYTLHAGSVYYTFFYYSSNMEKVIEQIIYSFNTQEAHKS